MTRPGTLLVAGFLSLWASTAVAQDDEGPLVSPQHFALEGKIGPYLPHIDNSNGLTDTPFSDLFGDPTAPKGAAPTRWLLGGIEFDYQFLRKFGSLGVGLSVEYYRKTAKQPLYFGTNSQPPLTACTVAQNAQDPQNGPRQYLLGGISKTPADCLSGDDNILNILPLVALVVYRFDYLAERYHIPIIPYIKGGLGYYIWWNQTSGSFVAHFDVDASGNKVPNAPAVSGASFGLVVLPGVALDLGVIDRQAARVLDHTTGINRVTLFIELNYAWINGFGRPNKLDLGDTTFNAGLGFEF